MSLLCFPSIRIGCTYVRASELGGLPSCASPRQVETVTVQVGSLPPTGSSEAFEPATGEIERSPSQLFHPVHHPLCTLRYRTHHLLFSLCFTTQVLYFRADPGPLSLLFPLVFPQPFRAGPKVKERSPTTPTIGKAMTSVALRQWPNGL